MAYRSITSSGLTDTTHASTFRPPMTTRTYVESNVPTKAEEGPEVGGHTLPATDDGSGYDPFAGSDGSDVGGDYDEGDPNVGGETTGLTTGAKVLIGAAALGGLFFIIRAMR